MKNTRNCICLAVVAVIGFVALSLTGCPNEDRFETVATPVANLVDGEIILTTATPGAEIYYKDDGSTPTRSNNILYSDKGPISITTGKMPVTIKAIAVKSGMYDSALMEAVYLPNNAVQFTEGIWENGNLPETNSVQWFRFTATATNQYIHAILGTIDSYYGVYVEVYGSDGILVGDKGNLSYSSCYAKTRFWVFFHSS